MSEKTTLTCPNKSCEKTFTKPLKTMNLQQESKGPYYACPYCLTEITITEDLPDIPPEEIEAEIELPKEESIQNQEELSTCKHYFGYLREKKPGQQISDECIVCTKIIDCMIKKDNI